MATVSQGEIASAFLRELGAPDNAVMRRAVIAWMRAESGMTIRANNPWNMTIGAAQETGIKTCGSWKSQSSGLVFAAFCSPQDGARASARLLLHGGNDWRGYGRVVAAARKGDPIGFLNALAHSAWDGGRYGTKNGGPNKLLGIYASLGGDVSSAQAQLTGGASNAKLTSSSTTGLAAQLTKIFTDMGLTDPAHIITPDEAKAIGAKLGNVNLGHDLVGRSVGEVTSTAALDPLGALGRIAASIAALVGALFDPRKWLLFFGLLAGVALTAYGGSNVLSAAR